MCLQARRSHTTRSTYIHIVDNFCHFGRRTLSLPYYGAVLLQYKDGSSSRHLFSSCLSSSGMRSLSTITFGARGEGCPSRRYLAPICQRRHAVIIQDRTATGQASAHTILYSFRLAAAAMLVVVRDEADNIWRGWESPPFRLTFPLSLPCLGWRSSLLWPALARAPRNAVAD